MNNASSSALKKAKQQHFDFLRKNNAITDAKNGELSLGAMRSLDVILQKYQESQETQMQLELSYLRKKLGLENNNDYIKRIKTYLLELKLPFELRDFNDMRTGKAVEWALTSFLNDVKSYKESQHLVEINISEDFINYMVDKAGYTQIDLSLSKQFKTKYGYKIYEMYLRYYALPNKIEGNRGIIYKNINELNDKFGTTHKHVSKMLEGINRGIKEIYTLTNSQIICTYDKIEKRFIFSWEKGAKKILQCNKCKIPEERIDELCEWIIEHSQKDIDDESAYTRKVKDLLLKDSFVGWEESYRGMLSIRYGFETEKIDSLKQEDGTYLNF